MSKYLPGPIFVRHSPRRARILVVSALAGLLGACATTGWQGESPPADASNNNFLSNDADPWRPFNERVFAFNQHADRYVLKPAATVYSDTVPPPLRLGVTNFFHNLGEPGDMLNDLLQARFHRLAVDAGRFAVNTTVGVFGLVDVASAIGLDAEPQDVGITLAKWGVKSGPYLVLPLLGPSDLRDAIGTGGDYYLKPTTYLANSKAQWSTFGLDVVNTRAAYLGAGGVLAQASGGDEYDFVREAYRQKRQYDVSQGSPPPPPPPPPFP